MTSVHPGSWFIHGPLRVAFLTTGLVLAAAFCAAERAAANTITVNTTADTSAVDGSCSLREAITAANTNAAVNECSAGSSGSDTIEFNLGSGTPTITLSSPLPTATEPLVIDGNTGGATRVELNGNGVGGLDINGGNSTVRALVINRFPANGIDIASNGGNTIENCYIGTDATGTMDLGNAANGVRILSSNNTIGGTTAAARNVISGNDVAGVLIQGGSNNVVEGNYIGTDVNGTADLGQGSGKVTDRGFGSGKAW